MSDATVAVLGFGSWGTALAVHLARCGHRVKLWGRDGAAIDAAARTRTNARYLPQITFPDTLTPTADLGAAVASASSVLVAVPSGVFRAVLQQIKPHLQSGSHVIWATKGLEQVSNKLLHDVAREVLGTDTPLALVSGPTFAAEVARGLPTAVTVASNDSTCAQYFAQLLHAPTFRAYTSDDMVGVQVGGAIKNVLAIGSGISDGLGFGANARAALITRGLVEMTRLGVTLGGKRETLMGLSGLGDLILTCTDNQSRNRRLGLALGAGKTVAQAQHEIQQVVEGVQTAREIFELARARGIEMPITAQVHSVLYDGISPRAAVQALMERTQKAESF